MAHPAVDLMRAEMRVRYGKVGSELDGVHVPAGQHYLRGDSFLLRQAGGLGFSYSRGGGITIERSSQSSPIDEQLHLNGTVYCAVAAINGLYPLHASAVAWRDEVYAFSGPSGAGKSTLVTALAQRGLKLFCDDTLLLDLSNPGRPLALPGHKRLKLTPQALDLLAMPGEDKVAPEIDKFYAASPSGTVDHPQPLARLVFLETGEQIGLRAVTGGQRLARLNDEHYTAHLFTLAKSSAAQDVFEQRAALARSVAMTEFVRPIDPLQFAQGVDCLIGELFEGFAPQ